MSRMRILLLCSLIVVSLNLTIIAQEAVNPFAPTGAIDEMSQAPVNTGTGQMALDRTRDTAQPRSRIGSPTGDPEAALFQQETSRDRTGRRPGMGMGIGEMEPGIGMGRQQAEPTPPPTPTPEMVRVLAGSRVVCAVTGKLLEDTVYRQVEKANLEGNFFDDGTHGDQEAGDGTYTNITTIDNVMSPDAHAILVRVLKMLKIIEDTEPMDFFRLDAVSYDPLSDLPMNITEEQDRDIKLTEWNDRFLQMFRTDENDPRSEFYQLYVPPPVSMPNLPLPQGFQPILKATPTPVQGGQGMGLQGGEGSLYGGRGNRSQYMEGPGMY